MKYVANLQWNNLNATRNYPIVDNASRVDNRGNELPNDIITDLRIQAAYGLGSNLYIGSVSISPKLVSVSIVADDGVTLQLAATVTVQTPVDINRNYELVPTGLVENTSGWLTFGNGANTNAPTNYIFSTVAQTKLIPGLAVSTPLPIGGVTGLRKIGRASSLSGVVGLLSAATDELIIEVVKSTDSDARVINGVAVDAIVFRLNSAVGGAALYQKFLGPCDKSPESGTCNKPPIYGINGAIPDCNGTITIHFVEDASELGPIFTITKTGSSPSWIQIASAIDQSMVCGLTANQFTQYCPDDCVIPLVTGPFASYNPHYGGSY